MRGSFLLLIGCSLLAGCQMIRMSRTGPAFPPREPQCGFYVFTTSPWGPFVEIGVLDIHPAEAPSDMDSLRRMIQQQVCSAGGDAIVAFANGRGEYIKATILKQVAAAAPAPPPPSAIPGPDPGQGCHYDTQCKGDRICVNGSCVSPSASPPAKTPH